MGRSATAKEEIPDVIDIISVGELFTGPWEKKYWSSNRGKHRYPYPVGYKTARTENGVSCTMEILQGLRGPSFVISSSDGGKSCYGDTPNMAWESFQKKGCSMFSNAKIFPWKMDGAEFFGLKHKFIQRLLRQLVAKGYRTAEESILPSNFSNQCKPSSPPDPDLLTSLVESNVKGKRKRNDKVVTTKRLSKTCVNQHQQQNNGSSSNSKPRDQPNSGSCGPSTFADADEVSRFCHRPGILEPDENEKVVPIAGTSKLGITNHLKVGGSLSHGEELASSINHFKLAIDNLLQNQEPSGKVKGLNNLTQEERAGFGNFQNLTQEESAGSGNSQNGLSVVDGDDLWVPDSLDEAGDSSSVSSLKNGVDESELLVADSFPEDEISISVCNTSLGKCDTDLIDQELANSMMTLLLPRAVPLLETFTGKKKNMPNIANGQAEHSDLERRKGKAWSPCSRHDSVVSTSGNSDSVVPDSFCNDVPQELLLHGDAGQFSCNPNPFLCHSGIREHDTGTSDATLMAAADTVLAPAKEIIANSKQAKIGYSSGDKVPASQMEGASTSESMISKVFQDIFMSEKGDANFAFGEFGDVDFDDCDTSSSNLQSPSTSCCSMTEKNDESWSNAHQKAKLNNKLGGLFKLSGCYVHPMPISMVQLTVKENEMFIFVKCGYSEHKESTLFLYKAPQKGQKMGCPSLIGHVPIALQISKDVVGRDIAADRSLLQLTPDAQSVVLLNSIKTPCCREAKLHCPCRDCTSDICERNAVKVVRLKRGYASVVTKLKTAQGICCLLVCEPSFLLAAEEDGKLKLWVMNSAWSGQKEDWYMPTFDWMFPTILELKTITKSAVLVVGHNGFGEFGIWDIDKRNLVSRFSSPGLSVLECIPASVFRWQRKGHCTTESIINDIMDATKTRFSAAREDCRFSPVDSDVAVWLLISTPPDPDWQSCEQETNPVGYWRLALLVNNLVITGAVVDGGAAAVTPVGHGVGGGNDGMVYLWELSTGKKLGNLHSFKGSRVSYITTDTSESGALAIASADQLLVYLPS